jgi:hypothetical protein
MARWQPQGNIEPPASTIQPRYRRLLTVGALLDESIQLFRQHWITLAWFGLVALVPSWLLLLLIYATGFQRAVVASSASAITNIGDSISFEQVALFGGLSLLSGLLTLLWSVASTVAAYAFVRGDRPRLSQVYVQALGRLPAILGGTLLLVVAALVLSAASIVLLVPTLGGTLGTLIALIGLLNWWRNPRSRRRWVKWLIILSAPFGLLTYYLVRWTVWLPAMIVEGRGPLDALRRSSQLTDHAWFRTGAVLVLVSLIVLVLMAVPVWLADVVFALVARPSFGTSTNEALSLLNGTVSTVCRVLFSSIAAITSVLLLIDLRNRREGTDLGERIGSLEAMTA